MALSKVADVRGRIWRSTINEIHGDQVNYNTTIISQGTNEHILACLI
jgi:hypothetical protein